MTMNWILEIDQSLFYFFNTTLSNSIFDVFFPFITDLHKNIFFAPIVYPVLILLLYKRHAKRGFLIFLFCALALATTDLVGNHVFKKNVQRLRPGDNPAVQAIVRSPYGGYSFTSNHSSNMFAFAMFMGFFLPYLRVFFYVIAFLVAFSRIYCGVHFPADVFFGALLGLAISYVYLKLYLKLIERQKVLRS